MNDGLALPSRSIQAPGLKMRHQQVGEHDMTMRTYAAALGLALLPLTALAQTAQSPSSAPAAQPDREAYRAACAADVQKFCANIEKAKGAMRGCLQTHEKELSASCKAARAERAAAKAKEKS
jgi:Cysteine rich repeat